MPDLLERLKSALVDRYAVESEIGSGGMAVVFLAEDLKHHRKVAIKVLHPELTASVGGDRFLREIEIAARLEHAHILSLIDSGEADGLFYYVMPYVDGESLRDRLEREKQLPIEEAIRIAGEVADGLGHAHRQGVVHRDIKPANILMSEGHALISDFGVARAVGAEGQALTRTGLAVGTPSYMSPEQASGAEEVDARSDLYALGCVLYEMLAGEPPLTGPTPQATATLRLTETATSLPVLRETVPGGLDRVVGRALAKSPVDRYGTAEEFADAMAAPEVWEEAKKRRKVGRRMLDGVIAVVLLGAGVFLAQLFVGGGPAVELSESVAVLPFVNMSSDPDQEYFSDGISEQLRNLLMQIPELRVAARTSSVSFKGQNLTIPEMAERLNVAHVLEGSVRKDGNDVRITAQLIRADDGLSVWSDAWDRSLDDIFEIQDEIAAEVVAQLQVTLLGAAPTLETTDPKAYALFLQARQLSRQATPESLELSDALYQQALEIDPDYATAWAGLALTYIYRSDLGLLPEGRRLAREAANRALEIDPENAEAYARLGKLASNPAEAAPYFERALALAPTNPDIILAVALQLRRLGRLDEAIALHEYAVDSDPVAANMHAGLGHAYVRAGRLDEAIASFRTSLTLSPGQNAAQLGIGPALLLNGEPEAALVTFVDEDDEWWRLTGFAMAHHALGQTAESDAALAELIEKYEQGMAYNIAYVLAFRGEADRAFEWLDKAVEYGDSGLGEIAYDLLFANIHDDPRWLPFLESIGESPEQRAVDRAAIEFEVTLPQ